MFYSVPTRDVGIEAPRLDQR
eukprot:SAG11_NODE_15725_length_568_cov_0.884861_2_plen_20_part_01